MTAPTDSPAGCSCFQQYAFVVAQDAARHAVPTIALRPLLAFATKLAAQTFVVQEQHERIGNRLGRLRRHQEAIDPGGDDAGKPFDIACDYRQPGGEGLHDDVTLAFVSRVRRAVHMRTVVVAGQVLVGHVRAEDHVAVVAHQPLVAPEVASAHHDQASILPALAEPHVCPQQVFQALALFGPAHKKDVQLPVGEFRQCLVWCRPVVVVHPVRNDVEVALEVP